jgi:methyl-accepting chemotaxis protein
MASAQRELVELVKGVLGESMSHSDKLGDTLRTINDDMMRIKDSNDEVVNSTSRLLATSEEFTASTQETIRISRNNMDKIEGSIGIMADISAKMQQLAEE